MRQFPTHAALALILSAGLPAQNLINGDFEAGPPSLPGWHNLGAVLAKSPGRKGGHSAWLGPAKGVSLLNDWFFATTIWQVVDGTDPAATTFGRFERSIFSPRSRLFVEVHGPQGVLASEIPQSPAFESFEWSYPEGKEPLLVAFTLIARMEAPNPVKIVGSCKIDDVEIKQDTVGFLDPVRPPTRLKLTPGWPNRQSTNGWDRAFAAIFDMRKAADQAATLPKGFRSNEGDGAHSAILFSHPKVTYQQLDGTHMSTPLRNIRALGFRRDHGMATNPAFVARKVDLEIVLGMGDPQRFGTDFAANFTVGPSTRVFDRKSVNLPSWAQKPTTASPSPWDIRFVFDRPWTYPATDPLIYQISVHANTLGPGAPWNNYPIDFQSTKGTFQPTKNVGTPIGTGCTTQGNQGPFTIALDFYNHSVKTRVRGSATNAPASSPVSMFLNTSDANLTPGFTCSKIHALPLLYLPAGNSDANGRVSRFEFDHLPYNPAALTQDFFFQANSADFTQTGLPFSFSNAIKVRIPSPRTYPTVGRVYEYRTYSNRTSIYGPATGALVTRIEF